MKYNQTVYVMIYNKKLETKFGSDAIIINLLSVFIEIFPIENSKAIIDKTLEQNFHISQNSNFFFGNQPKNKNINWKKIVGFESIQVLNNRDMIKDAT